MSHQYLATASANILSISYGVVCGWPSASFLTLQSKDSPLETGPMTSEESGTVAAMLAVGALVGDLVFAVLADAIGRKLSLQLCAIPNFIAWIIIPVAKNPTHLYISRFFSGLAGGGVFAVLPTFTTEIAEDRLRGILGVFLVFSVNIGFVVAFVLGYLFRYDIVAMILVPSSILFLLTFSFMPETPAYLLKKNKDMEAAKSLNFYRSNALDIIPMEMEKLKKISAQSDSEKGVSLADFTNRIAIKALLLSIVLMFLNQFSGCFAMVSYSATIFQQSGSNLKPKVASIIVGVIQLFGSYLSTVLVERAGRKPLLIISSIGAASGLFCYGVYSYSLAKGNDVSAFNFVPLASFSITVLLGSIGVISLPFLVFAEIMPPRIRVLGCMISMMFFWVFMIITLRFLPQMIEVIGMHGTMFFFCACLIVGILIIIIFLPETSGKSIEEILALL